MKEKGAHYRKRKVLTEEQERVQQRFYNVFGGQFIGHASLLNKKMNQLKTHIQTVDSKRHSTKFLHHDLVDIIDYVHNVESKVKEAVVGDKFSQIKNLDQLGNLMEDYDAMLGLQFKPE